MAVLPASPRAPADAAQGDGDQKMKKRLCVILSGALLLAGIGLQSAWCEETAEFRYDEAALPGAKPWTSQELQAKPQEFQFLIIGAYP